MSDKKIGIDREIDEMCLPEIGSFNRIVIEAKDKKSFNIKLYDGDNYRGSGYWDKNTRIMEVRNSYSYGVRHLDVGEKSLCLYVSNWRGGESALLNSTGSEKVNNFMVELDKVVSKINFNENERTIHSDKLGIQYKINVVGDSVSFYEVDDKGNRKGSYLEVIGDSVEFEKYDDEGVLKSSCKDGKYTFYNSDGTSVSYSRKVYDGDKEIITQISTGKDGNKTVIDDENAGIMEIKTDEHVTKVYFSDEAAIKAGEKPYFPIRKMDPLIIRTDNAGNKEDISPHQGDLKGLLYTAMEGDDSDYAYRIVECMVKDCLGKTEEFNEFEGYKTVRNKIESATVMPLDDGNVVVIGMYSDFYGVPGSFTSNDSKYYGLRYAIVNPDTREIVAKDNTGHYRCDKGDLSVTMREDDGKIHFTLNRQEPSEKMCEISISGKVVDKEQLADKGDRIVNYHPEMRLFEKRTIELFDSNYKGTIKKVKDVAELIKKAYNKDEVENTVYNKQAAIRDIVAAQRVRG